MNFSESSLLIVEDEHNLGQTLKDFLSSQGFTVTWAKGESEALDALEKTSPKVILLDIGLPDGDGFNVAKYVREKFKNSVLFFLSAQSDPETRVKGLEIGAHDFIGKPFNLQELNLRLKRALTSIDKKSHLPDQVQIGSLKIYFKSFEIELGNGEIVAMGQKECSILEYLLDKAGEAISREEIIKNIWGEDQFPSNRTVDNYIVTIRKWCETDIENKIKIKSIRGFGYKLILSNQ